MPTRGASLPGRWRQGTWLTLARLGSLLVLFVALSGHVRRLDPPAHGGVDGALAQVLVRRDGRVVARGSGVVIATRDEDGTPACYLLTAGHVLSPGGDGVDVVVVFPPDGTGRRGLPGERLYEVDTDEQDLAVLRTVGTACRPAALGPSLERGGDVWLGAMGADGLPRVWPGHVREIPGPGGAGWTVDGTVTEGASGGGVFDARTGGLVGLIQGYWTARLIVAGAQVAAEVPAGTTAVISLAHVRTQLEAWGVEDLLDSSERAPSDPSLQDGPRRQRRPEPASLVPGGARLPPSRTSLSP